MLGTGGVTGNIKETGAWPLSTGNCKGHQAAALRSSLGHHGVSIPGSAS